MSFSYQNEKNLAKILKKNPILLKIKETLETLELKEEDFALSPGTRGPTHAHTLVIDEIKHALDAESQKIKGGRYGADIVKRGSDFGRILLLGEIDTFKSLNTPDKPLHNLTRLLDIRSENKVWIYVSNDEARERTKFDDAIEKLGSLIKERGENKATIGNFIVFMKTPTSILKMKKVI